MQAAQDTAVSPVPQPPVPPEASAADLLKSNLFVELSGHGIVRTFLAGRRRRHGGLQLQGATSPREFSREPILHRRGGGTLKGQAVTIMITPDSGSTTLACWVGGTSKSTAARRSKMTALGPASFHSPQALRGQPSAFRSPKPAPPRRQSAKKILTYSASYPRRNRGRSAATVYANPPLRSIGSRQADRRQACRRFPPVADHLICGARTAYCCRGKAGEERIMR
jgi:hypothetical protein